MKWTWEGQQEGDSLSLGGLGSVVLSCAVAELLSSEVLGKGAEEQVSLKDQQVPGRSCSLRRGWRRLPRSQPPGPLLAPGLSRPGLADFHFILYNDFPPPWND